MSSLPEIITIEDDSISEHLDLVGRQLSALDMPNNTVRTKQFRQLDGTVDADAEVVRDNRRTQSDIVIYDSALGGLAAMLDIRNELRALCPSGGASIQLVTGTKTDGSFFTSLQISNPNRPVILCIARRKKPADSKVEGAASAFVHEMPITSDSPEFERIFNPKILRGIASFAFGLTEQAVNTPDPTI